MPRAEPYGLLKYKGLLTGDDNWATVIDEEMPYKNAKGMWMKRYLIAPGEHLIKQYPYLQKPESYTYKGVALWVEYPMKWIVDANPSRTNAIARIDCAFDGRETPYTQRYKHLTDEITRLEQENEALVLSNIRLTEENKSLMGDFKEKMKDFVELQELGIGDKGGHEEYHNPDD